jgi:5-methyltetrahydrofolate--homocysteine methyltransferase
MTSRQGRLKNKFGQGAPSNHDPGITGPAGSEVSERSLMLQKLSQAVILRDSRSVGELTTRLAAEGVDLFDILNLGLLPGVLVAGERFRKGEFFIPELLMSTRALKLGLDVLRPLIRERRQSFLGKVVIGTVRFDLHDIGKNLVAILLEGSGFEVVDLGVDVSPDRFVKTAAKHNAQILAMSSLLTSTMGWMKSTIDLLRAKGMNTDIKTLVGGAPVSLVFARNIKADGYCREAATTPKTARALLGLGE